MKNLLPALAVLVLLPASLWAGARSDLDTCAANSNDPACFGSSNMPQPTPVDATDSTPGPSGSPLSRPSGPQTDSFGVDVPPAQPVKVHHHPLSFIKKHGKLILGTLAAGGGAYFGFTHVAAFAGLGGPWGAAAMGAAAAFLLVAFVLPKIIGLFHHHKNVD